MRLLKKLYFILWTVKKTIFRFGKAISRFLLYWKEFGFFLAKVQFKEELFSKRIGYSDCYIEKASEYMIEELQPIISSYNKSLVYYEHSSDAKSYNDKIYVWICWWQGYNQMPTVVKSCYHRILNIFRSTNTEVILITEDNYKNYISFPEYIVEKYKCGKIGNAHFADLLRWGLMAKWGGVWLDATVFLTCKSIETLNAELSFPFYTQRFRDPSECPNEPCRGLWCNSYFMGKHQENVRIFDFVYESLLYYWKRHNFAFHYVFLDYIIWAGYVTIKDISKLIDAVPANNKHIWYLYSKMNDPCCEEEWMNVLNKNGFYKLTYKENWKEYTNNNELTYYGRFLAYNNDLEVI